MILISRPFHTGATKTSTELATHQPCQEPVQWPRRTASANCSPWASLTTIADRTDRRVHTVVGADLERHLGDLLQVILSAGGDAAKEDLFRNNAHRGSCTFDLGAVP